MCFLMTETEFASYADNDVIKMLENDSIRPFKWFSDNQMKANKYKCDFNVSNNEYAFIKINDIEVKSSGCEKLLGI